MASARTAVDAEGTWPAITPAPSPAVTVRLPLDGRQLLVWDGHGRIPGAGLRPLRDGAA